MVVTVTDIIECLDKIAPFGMAESWDNVGLLVGDASRPVSSLLVGLDPTNRLLDEAIERSADTVVTHHPAIFKPLSAVDTSEPDGRFLETALGGRLTVISCHTNFDSTAGGVNDILAELLGLTATRPLVPADRRYGEQAGLGRVGIYETPLGRRAFIDRLLDVLDLPSFAMAGSLPETIATVAVCGGSGSEFARIARDGGADVYLTAELKHNTARWAEQSGFCVIDGTHFATEKPAVALLAGRLRDYGAERGWPVSVLETMTEQHPFTVVTTDTFRCKECNKG